jgi:hypothetical protein
MLRYHSVHPPRLVGIHLVLYDVHLASFSSSLTTWLAHSKKKTCDVCKHPYSFTKGPSIILFHFSRPYPYLSLRNGYANQIAAGTSPATGSTAIVLCNALRRACGSCRNHMACISALGHCYDMENVFFHGGFYVCFFEHLWIIEC